MTRSSNPNKAAAFGLPATDEVALALADQAAEEDSALTEAVNLRLAVHLARRGHPAVLKELRAYRQHSGIVLDRKALAEDKKYAEFLTTPEFGVWEKEIALRP